MDAETPHSGRGDEVKTETVRIFTNHEAADLAAANLRAHGIRCWIIADDGGGMLPNLAGPGGVRLLVGASDSEAAGALLAASTPTAETSGPIETEAVLAPPATAAGQTTFAIGLITIGMVTGVLRCLLWQWYDQLGTHTRFLHTREGKAYEALVYRDGHIVEIMRDRNLDGAWDRWIYYEHGQVVRSEDDNNFDGKPDETWTYSNGLVEKMSKDTDFNGTPDMFCTYKYGLVQQVDMMPNGAKFATVRDLYRNGVLVEVLRGGDAEGHFKEAVRYDPFFNPISTNQP